MPARLARLFRRATSPVWYGSYYTGGKRVTRSTQQLDKRAAAAVLREWERRASDPAHAAAHETTLGDALQNLMRDRVLRGRAEGTLDCYRVKGGHVTRILGEDLPLRRVTARAVDAFVDQRLAEGAARNTIHKELTALRGALRVAKRRGEFSADIAAVMPDSFSPEYKPRERYLTAAQAQALLAELEPDRAARVAFILATGARWSESDRARVADVDLARGVVRLRGTKTEASWRLVPAVGWAVPLLEHSLSERGGAGVEMFTSWGNVRRDLAAACRRAKIPAATPNDLRRTCGTWWRQHEVEPHLIGALLGHRDSRMVERVYGRMPVESLGAALERRLPAPAEGAAGQCSNSAANQIPSAAHSAHGATPAGAKTPGFMVSEDGIEPPTRGFSVPASRIVTRRNREDNPWTGDRVQRLCSKRLAPGK